MDKVQFLRDFERISEKLRKLIDQDPRTAIFEARSILSTLNLLDETHRQILAGIALTDAGYDCRDYDAANEAVAIMEQLETAHPCDQNILYNLANALITRANLTVQYTPTDWCAITSKDRLRAKVLYQALADHPESEHDLRARALIKC